MRLCLPGSPLALAVVLLAASLTACPQPSGGSSSPRSGGNKAAPAGDPIAKVGDSTITVEQIQKRLDEQSPFVRVRYTDPEKKKEFLDSQVRFEVLAAEAFARGLDQDPDVLEATKKIIVQKLTRDEFDSRVKLQDIGDADLQKYFEEHKADYQKPAMVRASDIAVAFGPDAASKAKAKKLADETQKKAADKGKLEDRNHFKDLAAQVSTDEESKRAGGDLRYITAQEAEEKLGAPIKAWLFGGDTINEVSPVLEGKDAFHIVKRTGQRKEIVRTFEQVKNQIKNVVFREKRTEAFNTFVDGLKTKHGVKVYEEKLDKLKVNAQMPPQGEPGDPHGGLGLPAAPGSDDEAERLDAEPAGGGGAPPVPGPTPAPTPAPTPSNQPLPSPG